MKNLSLLLLSILLCLSCEKEAELCSLPPDSTPAWMNDFYDDLQQSDLGKFFYFQSAELDKKQVFVLNNCCPNCGTIIQVYNCEGQVIGNLGDDIDPNDLNNLQLFLTPPDFQCQVEADNSPQ